jgi:anaerobic selenocysteine-containing dehydrogenase
MVEAMAGSAEDWKRRLLRPVAGRGVTLETLREGPVRNPKTGALRFPDRKVETPSGKVRLLGAAAVAPAPDPERHADYPLWLFSNSTAESQASQWVGDGPGRLLWVAVHPAAAGGLRDGDEVVLESRHGALRAVLRLDGSQRQDVAIVPKGGHFDRGQSANSLIAARATDLGLGAAYLDCRVRIRDPGSPR